MSLVASALAPPGPPGRPEASSAPRPGGPESPDSRQERAAKRRRQWVRECWFIAISYSINGGLISAFSVTATVPWFAGLSYAVPGVAISAVLAYLIATGRSQRMRDASLSIVHTGACAALCLIGVTLFPAIAFAYALILFTAFLTATYRSPLRLVQTLLIVTVLLFGLLTLGLGHRLRLPDRSVQEQALAWLFFVVTLARYVLLSVINTRSLLLLRQHNERMAVTLAQIERLANHDELTGVLNRPRLIHILNEEMARTDRMQTPLAVALLDLDHFKAINDTLGHLVGDEVLKRFAHEVQALSRNTDRFGRYGGEEFLLILTNADPVQAEQAIARIRSALAPVDWSTVDPSLRVTFSAGLAAYRLGDSCEQLLSRADHALYEAKSAGRNCTRTAH